MASSKKSNEAGGDIEVPQSWGVFSAIAFCLVLAVGPAVYIVFTEPTWSTATMVVLALVWSALGGLLGLWVWSGQMRERSALLREQLSAVETEPDTQLHVGWLDAWVGVIERPLFAALIGFTVPGAAAFVAIWVAVKLAATWPCGHADGALGRLRFLCAAAGNALSVTFGVAAGLLIQYVIQ